MVNLEERIEEHDSGTGPTSRTAGDNELSNGATQDGMINYLAVDSEVCTRKLTVRDSGSWQHNSSSKSGRLKEPEGETDSADDELPRRNRSPSRGPSRTKKDLGRSQSRTTLRRKVNSSLASTAPIKTSKTSNTSKSSKSSKSGRHHPLVAEVT